MTTTAPHLGPTSTRRRSVVTVLSITTGAIAANFSFAQGLLAVIGRDLGAHDGAGILVLGSQIRLA